MLIEWGLGLSGVICYAATRKSKRSRRLLIALSIPVYLLAGIFAYVVMILIVVLLCRVSPNVDGLMPFFPILKLAALASEIAIAIGIIRRIARGKAMRSEPAVEKSETS